MRFVDVKQGKALGLNRWPSRHWTINKAWTQIVLLAAYRWLALEPGDLRAASLVTRRSPAWLVDKRSTLSTVVCCAGADIGPANYRGPPSQSVRHIPINRGMR